MLRVPDLLHWTPRLDVDHQQLHELFGLAFTGRGDAPGIDTALARKSAGHSWQPEQFAQDLFIRELISGHFTISLDGKRYATNTEFHFRTLVEPPSDFDSIHMRQGILKELDEDPAMLRRVEQLYGRIYDLINMFKVPGRLARLDIDAFRVDLFRLVQQAIDDMATEFSTSRSGLRRLTEVGRELQASEAYGIVAALVSYESHRASLNIKLRVGATGKITDLEVTGLNPNDQNPFYQPPLKRWIAKARAMLWHGIHLHDEAIVSRLVQDVYDRLATPLMGLGQLLGQLEIYLALHQWKERMATRGLTMSLAEVRDRGQLRLEGVFNPLLAIDGSTPTPARIHQQDAQSVTLITGPNSGGKTRLLQALGLSQLLGQGGFYVPAAEAQLVKAEGMFVSLIEHEAVAHAEGRLGRELERIRSMFDAMQLPSMIILDELCSGTNPSEGTEVFSLVLRLLDEAEPMAFITTHFLDFARELERQPPIDKLRFLQVEIDPNQRSTYQFVPGVAGTSLAALMAERMGVTFDAISQSLRRRQRPATEGTQSTPVRLDDNPVQLDRGSMSLSPRVKQRIEPVPGPEDSAQTLPL